MARFREVIDVAAPPERAFAYVSDFTTAAEWDPGIVSSRRTSGDGGVGTTYAVDAEFRGRALPFVYTVTALEPGRRIVLHFGRWDERWERDDGSWNDLRISSSASALAAYRAGVADRRYAATPTLRCRSSR